MSGRRLLNSVYDGAGCHPAEDGPLPSSQRGA